jgi:hypothetical protein
VSVRVAQHRPPRALSSICQTRSGGARVFGQAGVASRAVIRMRL